MRIEYNCVKRIFFNSYLRPMQLISHFIEVDELLNGN